MADKKLAKAIAYDLAAEEMDRLVHPTVSGMDDDIENPNPFLRPRGFKIFQSDKQYKWFKEGANVSPNDYGKIIPRLSKGQEESLDREDLMDSVTGTLLRIERGALVYEDDEAKKEMRVLDRVKETLPSRTSEEFKTWSEDNYPKVFDNVVLVRFALFSAEKTYKLLKQLADGEDVETPLGEIWLQGAKYGGVWEIRNKMGELLKTDKFWSEKSNQEQAGVLKSLYRLEISSRKEKSQNDIEYYTYDYNLSLNTPEEALKFEALIVQLDEFPYFGRQTETIEGEEVTPEDVEGDDNDIDLDSDDLPFNTSK